MALDGHDPLLLWLARAAGLLLKCEAFGPMMEPEQPEPTDFTRGRRPADRNVHLTEQQGSLAPHLPLPLFLRKSEVFTLE